MKEWFKKNFFILLFCILLIVISNALQSRPLTIMLIIGLLLLVLETFIKNKKAQKNIRNLGFLLIIFACLLSQGATFLFVFLLVGLWLWRTGDKYDLFNLNEECLSSSQGPQYHGIKIVESQSKQRFSSVESLRVANKPKDEYSSQDINLVHFYGDHIVDFGTTIIPDEEVVVVIQKFYGRTRVILPTGIGVHLNISMLNGSVIIDDEKEDLTSQQLKWENEIYNDSQKKVKIYINSVFGDVEVIFA